MNNDRKSRGLSGATIISFVVILVVVLWMANQLQMHQQEMTYTSFVSAVQEKNVSDVYINQNSAVPTGTVSVTLKDDGNTRKVNVSDVEQVEKLLTENQVEYRLSDVPKDSMLTTVVVPMLITLGGVFLIFFLMSRQNGGGNSKAMNFGKSRAKMSTKNEIKVTFRDVAGLREEKEELEEIVDFQYKVGTDTYESLQDRLQRLHKEGMEKFMKEEIFYVPDDYAENLVRQYTGQERKNMIAHLKHTLRILKFYTNNDFAFKDVHNEQLFLQNGKILVEVVQLFEKFRIIGSENLQMLGDLFEQLLSKGFKQNEGQFFTPVPITRFIWNSLPVEKILKTEEGAGLPKIIDYACGAGHFLTEGFEAVSACVKANDSLRELDRSFAENNIFGIEKDYRLARVSKISLFMHGAGEGNIIFGDGLENYPDKNIKPNTFDILVANPPYSVSAFKPHLKLKNNSFSILDTISNNGSEIETLFVERISQLLKPNAVAAVILPSSILNKENESFICARESILKNFKIRAIVLMGNKTFGATGTNTVVLFLEKYNEPPKKADLIEDSIDAVFNGCNLDGWEDKAILEQYLKKIDVSSEVYERFLSEAVDIGDIEDKYFLKYKEAFLALSKTKEKQKQKTFGKLSEKEQKKLLTKQYYQYVNKDRTGKNEIFLFCL